MTRRILLIAALGLGACAGSPAREPQPTVERHRPELHCTERPPGGERACRDRGCEWTAPLRCYGTEPPPEVVEARRRAYEAGEETCTCVCEEDRVRCMQLAALSPAVDRSARRSAGAPR